MASNALPSKLNRLFAVCDDMCDGLTLLEVPLGIKQNTEAILRAALAAGRAAEAAYGDSQVARKAANFTLTTADTAGRIFIGNARKRLSKFFGEAFSTEWAAAGWPDSSTAVPSTQEERFDLIASLKTHFTSHPAHESVDMDATAAIADTVYTNISDARAALAAKVALVGAAKNARDAAEVNLRKRGNGLIGELETVLSDEDPRWHNFGLSRPADEATPEAPGLITLIAGIVGRLLVDWEDALRADHYRVWIFIVGTDTAFRAVDSPSDSDASLSALPSGSTVRVHVTSVNAAGESAPSPEAQAVVP